VILFLVKFDGVVSILKLPDIWNEKYDSFKRINYTLKTLLHV